MRSSNLEAKTVVVDLNALSKLTWGGEGLLLLPAENTPGIHERTITLHSAMHLVTAGSSFVLADEETSPNTTAKNVF